MKQDEIDIIKKLLDIAYAHEGRHDATCRGRVTKPEVRDVIESTEAMLFRNGTCPRCAYIQTKP